MTAAELIAFEREVADRFERGEIHAPIHLSGGNEAQLIEIFKDVPREAWVLSTWRSHYHALLHGVPPEKVMAEIMAGRSMNLNFPEHRFLTSAIVGGILPIACGLAYAGEQVWCFVGDMTASIGAYWDALKLAHGVNFVVEDNGLSTNTPTKECWHFLAKECRYQYKRTFPHVGSGVYVAF
mgnify:FL=1